MSEKKDMKAALGNGLKPDITHVRSEFMIYCARACEYGNAKYERANYMRPVGGMKEDFERFRGYLRAANAHITKTLDAMELHQSQDPDLQDEPGMKAAAFAPDTDATPGAKVGASGLPHVAHAVASLNMAITQAAIYGLLPADPGQPWVTKSQYREDDPTVTITSSEMVRIENVNADTDDTYEGAPYADTDTGRYDAGRQEPNTGAALGKRR